MKKGDLITQLNATHAKDIDSLAVFLKNLPEDKDLLLQIIRKDTTQNLSVSLKAHDKDKYLKTIDVHRRGEISQEIRLQIGIVFNTFNMFELAEEELKKVLDENENNASLFMFKTK